MTFATLRALHALIGDALDDIEKVYRNASAESPIDPHSGWCSPLSPSPSPYSPYSPCSTAPSPYALSPGPHPSPSLLSPHSSESRAPSPAPSIGASSLSCYSGTDACSSRASSRLELDKEVACVTAATREVNRLACHSTSRIDVLVTRGTLEEPWTTVPATHMPPASAALISAPSITPSLTASTSTGSSVSLTGAASTPVRAQRKRSDTVTSASNAFRRVSTLLTGRNHSSANVPSPVTRSVPAFDAAVTPTSTPARSVFRPCASADLDSPGEGRLLSPIAFASPNTPFVSAATPVRRRATSITASVSALTRACTSGTSLSKDSPIANGKGVLLSKKSDSPSPIRFAPNPHARAYPGPASPETPTSTRRAECDGATLANDSPKTPMSGERERRRPKPLALLPPLTPTLTRLYDKYDGRNSQRQDAQEPPTPASLFSASSPSLVHAHTPGWSARDGLISSSEVSLSAVGTTLVSTPVSGASRASQSVPVLGAAWEEPVAGAVPTPPATGKRFGVDRRTPLYLDWPSLDEACYAVHASRSDEKKEEARASSPGQQSPCSSNTPGFRQEAAGITSDGASAKHRDCGNDGEREKWRQSEEDVRREAEERLTTHPAALAAVSRLVAACGQLCASVQRPFLTVCDAAMGYHLPACLRLVEAAHIPEILREAGPRGLHVKEIARRVGQIRRGATAASQSCAAFDSSGQPEHRDDNGDDMFGVDPSLLSHVLRLLATHHIMREVRPDVFVNNRVSSAMDSGKSAAELTERTVNKYEGTDGIAAFVGLCTDELFKSAAYLTDCYLPTLNDIKGEGDSRPHSVGQSYQAMAEGVPDVKSHASLADLALGKAEDSRAVQSAGPASTSLLNITQKQDLTNKESKNPMHAPFNIAFSTQAPYFEWLETANNVARLKRFGPAMTGTGAWEVPGAIVSGFPWHSLPQDSVVVDVGGGIGSTSLLLAHAFPHLRFLVQDRSQVVGMGEVAWRNRCPQFLEAGRAAFQAHDFFAPQPCWPPVLRGETSSTAGGENKDVPAVFLLRVITHDWPDLYVTRILLQLRHAAGPDTKLLLADWILPLACIDEDSDPESPRAAVKMGNKMKAQPLPGTVRSLAPEGSPLLPNLGKANANAYWLDLTMRVTFNAQERTLRELDSLTLTAGWRIVQVTRVEGSLFGHMIAIPTEIPPESIALLDAPLPGTCDTSASEDGESPLSTELRLPPMGDTFGSFVALPSDDDVRKGVKAGRRAAHKWQARANEWRQRLMKKSSAIWRDRKLSVAQSQSPPVPLVVPNSGLLPAAEVGVRPETTASIDRRGSRASGGMQGEEHKAGGVKERDKEKPRGLRKVLSRAQLGSGGGERQRERSMRASAGKT